MRKHEKGFTLIELLVVIAIIGILAALVLVALGNARDKANDAALRSDISQLRTLAEIVYDNSGSSYDTVDTCFAGTDADCGDTSTPSSVAALTADIQEKDGDDNPATSTFVANSSPTEFCLSAQLRTDQYVCVDASGAHSEGSAGCGTATACP